MAIYFRVFTGVKKFSSSDYCCNGIPFQRELLDAQLIYCLGHGSHMTNFCESVLTLRLKSVNSVMFSVHTKLLLFAKTLKIGKNVKDAVVLGWGRQILEKSS